MQRRGRNLPRGPEQEQAAVGERVCGEAREAGAPPRAPPRLRASARLFFCIFLVFGSAEARNGGGARGQSRHLTTKIFTK